MKKIIMLVCIMMSATAMMVAQNTFSIGPRAGVNFANVSEPDGTGSLTGLVLGVTSTYSINETSGLTLDLLYSQEGYEDPSGTEVSVDYLQVPLYFNVFLGNLGEAFRPKVYAGLAAGFPLSAEAAGVDIKDQMSGMVLAATGGLGFNYRIGNQTWLNVDLRSYLGLTDIRDDALRTGDKVASRNVQISAGIAFGL